jgi:dTDP-4-dehydrorhamnose 3,5-epimerase
MFKFTKTEIPEVILIEPQVFGDDRGFFLEAYKKSEFNNNGIIVDFVQDNHSKSKAKVLRGLHFQTGSSAQAKLVRCIKGEIFDVAVDLRQGSPTFLKWVGYVLSEENKKELFIPAEGFAHGFCVLSDEAEITYKCSREYDSKSEVGIIWNDKHIKVNWPISQPFISEKDAKNMTIESVFNLK